MAGIFDQKLLEVANHHGCLMEVTGPSHSENARAVTYVVINNPKIIRNFKMATATTTISHAAWKTNCYSCSRHPQCRLQQLLECPLPRRARREGQHGKGSPESHCLKRGHAVYSQRASETANGHKLHVIPEEPRLPHVMGTHKLQRRLGV